MKQEVLEALQEILSGVKDARARIATLAVRLPEDEGLEDGETHLRERLQQVVAEFDSLKGGELKTKLTLLAASPSLRGRLECAARDFEELGESVRLIVEEIGGEGCGLRGETGAGVPLEAAH